MHMHIIVLCYTVISTIRDGEDVDELLERQADMIRYLQQHTASLGRRIMELPLNSTFAHDAHITIATSIQNT